MFSVKCFLFTPHISEFSPNQTEIFAIEQKMRQLLTTSKILMLSSSHQLSPSALGSVTDHQGQKKNGCSVWTSQFQEALPMGRLHSMNGPFHCGARTPPILECLLPTRTNQGFSKPSHPWLGSKSAVTSENPCLWHDIWQKKPDIQHKL